METVHLSLGSNLGDRRAHLQRAIEHLRSLEVITRRMSSLYETEPVGFADQPWFLNRVVEAETDLSPESLLAACQQVEALEERVRSFPNAPRTLDLDILLYGACVVRDSRLVIPHPRMAKRRFVLAPLAEIAPRLVHPVLHLPIESLLEQCHDISTVRLYSPGDCKTCENT